MLVARHIKFLLTPLFPLFFSCPPFVCHQVSLPSSWLFLVYWVYLPGQTVSLSLGEWSMVGLCLVLCCCSSLVTSGVLWGHVGVSRGGITWATVCVFCFGSSVWVGVQSETSYCFIFIFQPLFPVYSVEFTTRIMYFVSFTSKNATEAKYFVSNFDYSDCLAPWGLSASHYAVSCKLLLSSALSMES